MMRLSRDASLIISLLFFSLVSRTVADDVLKTNGFTNCITNGTISVHEMNIQFDRSTNTVNFDVGGISNEVQNVTGNLQISAYGKVAFNKAFDPCGTDIHVPQLCPGKFI